MNYLYDGSGNRVAMQSTVNGTTTLTSYIGSIEEVQTSGSTTQTTTYYNVGGKRIGADVNGTFYYFGYDVLGSQIVVLDANGNLVGSQLYGPYGANRYSTGTLPTSIGFTGQRADSVTGLDYYVGRYYDPVVGQFLSEDGVQGNAQGVNPYAYVGGDPETRIDPTGHKFTQADAGGGGPAVDDPTGIGQLFGDIQNYLNSQNPFLSFAEEGVAAATAPIWVPIVLVIVILSIPSDSGPPSENSGSRQQNQSQNTSVSPTPESTPATNTGGAGVRAPNRPLSGDSEKYLFNHLSTILPGEAYVDNGKQVDNKGRYTTSKSVGTDIDLETTNMVINVGTYSKFYDYGTTTINERSIQKFYTAMSKYMKYAATVGKPVYFGYDIAWSKADIPVEVQNWLSQRGIQVLRFSSH